MFIEIASYSATAKASEPAGSTGASVATATVTAPSEAGAEPSTPWIHRHAPQRNTGEVGIYGGTIFPSENHELFDTDQTLPELGFKRLRKVAPEFGVRGGYYPLRFLGVEAEAGVMPTRTRDDARATMWHLRGHVVGQLGYWSVTPFVLLGAGALAVGSDRNAVGNDADLSLHFGGGVKVFLTDLIGLRLDVRDVVAGRRGVDDGLAHNPEVLLGLTISLGRKKATPPPPVDTDRDGFIGAADACPDKPGVAPDGCPAPDGDADGVLDAFDACPAEPANTPDGCPVRDGDADGFADDVDACPGVPGIAPDGCPDPDPDRDRIVGDADKCPAEPETANGFDDTDGCPDELPEEVKASTGVIEGIYFFERNKSAIDPRSKDVLNRAVEALKRYPSIRIEISGHSDITGSREHNIKLSHRRAEAVRTYLVQNGITGDRIVTRGAGPDEPIADNETEEGRKKNRRIEFKVLKEAAPKDAAPKDAAPKETAPKETAPKETAPKETAPKETAPKGQGQ